MKTAGIAMIAAAVLCGQASATPKYEPKSPYLKDPSRGINIIMSQADFWARAKDEVNGGFHSYVDRSGNPAFPTDYWWNTTMCDRTFDYYLRSVVGQSRVAYAFVRAFQVTGNESYLDLARHALAFLYKKGWDGEHGGWWFTTDQTGKVAPWLPCDWWDPNQWKWTYAQMYPLVGIGAMLEATSGKRITIPAETLVPGSDLDWYTKGIALVNDHLWDSRPGHAGYYESAGIDWSAPTGKGFTGTVDGMTTLGAPSTHVLWDMGMERRFAELAEVARSRLVSELDDPAVRFGYPEGYDSDWVVDPSNTSGMIGHVLKTSWTLGRAFLAFGRPEDREASTKAMRAVLDKGGYDFVNGGPYLNYDWTTGEVTHGKNYWMLEQAIVAGLINSQIAKHHEDRNDGLMIADQSLEFFVDHIIDWEMGGHWFETDDAGVVTNSLKGDLFEQGYHATELGYYVYLYGSVFLKKSPVSLYYLLAPSKKLQVVKLEPSELAPDSLRIVDVELNGRRFRGQVLGSTLILPPGVGGKFKVTFAPHQRG